MKPMTYSRLMQRGRSVHGLPCPKEGGDRGTWFVYGIVRKYRHCPPAIVLYYVNHIDRAICPYVDVFGQPIDPIAENAKRYSLHIERESERIY